MKQNSDTITKNTCEHCGRTFVRDSTLFKHLCEQKRRWMDMDKPAIRIAFSAWTEFYTVCQPSKKHKDYRAFIQSPYFTAFSKFGHYCIDIKAVSVDSYIRFLIRGKYAIDDWTSDRVYGQYLMEYLKTEDSMDAVRRTVTNMISECEQQNIELRDFFRFISTNKVCHMIVTGKISPWMLYHSKTGIEFLENLNDAQRNLVFAYIDPEKWMVKFKRNAEETNQVSNVLVQAGL